MSVVDIAVKTLRESVRQPRNLALTLGLPVVFMVIFGLAFGGSSTTTYKVAIVDEDAGDLGAQYAQHLKELAYDSGKPIVDERTYGDAAAARSALQARSVDLVVTIPANFSANLQPTVTPGTQSPVPGQSQPTQVAPPAGSSVDVLSDPGSASSNGARQVVDAYTASFAAKASGRQPLVVANDAIVAKQELTQFDYIAPGIMVYAVLSLAPQAAAVLARETELKTLDRIRLSPTRAATLLAGVALAELVLACVSTTLMLATARAMGFHNQGSYVEAFALTLTAAFAVLGIGMVIASFAKTQQEAANFGLLVSVPASFLSGAFFPVPGVTLFTWGSRSVGLYDALPTSHAVAALRQVLTYGRGLADVVPALEAMAVLAAIYFVAGVALYHRGRLAPE